MSIIIVGNYSGSDRQGEHISCLTLLQYLLFILVLVFSFSYPSLSNGAGDAGADSELKLSVSSDTVRPGETVTVTSWLSSGNNIVSGSGMVRYLMISAHITKPDSSGFSKALFDNGLDGDKSSGDGIFTCRFIADKEGDYSVRVLAEGKGLKKTAEYRLKALTEAQSSKNAPSAEHAEEAGEKPATALHEPEAVRYPSWTLFIALNVTAAVLWAVCFILLYVRMQRRPGPKTEKENIEIDLKPVLKDKKPVPDETDSLLEKAEEIGVISNELKEAKTPADEQAGKQGALADADLSGVEVQLLRETVSSLESELKNREKELEDLKKSFESLEAEYMVLYQEKQANQKQPEF